MYIYVIYVNVYLKKPMNYIFIIIAFITVKTVDNDIARHCAFSLPAVALTLGRSNWPLLKETYETLANDMQWKVRKL